MKSVFVMTETDPTYDDIGPVTAYDDKFSFQAMNRTATTIMQAQRVSGKEMPTEQDIGYSQQIDEMEAPVTTAAVIDEEKDKRVPKRTALNSSKQRIQRCNPLCGWPWWPQLILMGLCVFVFFGQVLKSVGIRYSYAYDALASASVDGNEIFEQPEQGGVSSSWHYNVWSGIKDLWNQEAYLLALFLGAWSGFWPYIKLTVIGIALIVYRNANIPDNYEWLSTIGRYSFIDIWFVLITAVAIRFETPALTSSKTQEVEGIIEVTTTVELSVWIISFALSGAFVFVAAISASQFIGYVLLRIGQWRSWISNEDVEDSNHLLSHRKPCDILYLGFQSMPPTCCSCEISSWVKICLVVTSFFFILAVLCFVLIAFHVGIFRTVFSLNLDIEVSETRDFTIDLPIFEPITIPFTYEESFSFENTERSTHSLYSLCWTMKDTVGGQGQSNEPMFYIAIIFIYYFTLIRIVLLAIAWIVPMPFVCHWIVFTTNEVISLFTSMDSFAVAYIIMCELGQLNYIFNHVAKSFGASSDDANYKVDFKVNQFLPGGAIFIAAAVVDQIHALVLMSLHRQMLMPPDTARTKRSTNVEQLSLPSEEDVVAVIIPERVVATAPPIELSVEYK